MKFRTALALALLLLLASTGAATAQEQMALGKMWTFEDAPLDYFEKTYGFRPTQKWLDDVRLSSLRFGDGCSASFVSAKGLIMTNHHCVRDEIAKISPSDKDWVKNGFLAPKMTDEQKIPGLTVQQLISMEDITKKINVGISNEMTDAQIKSTRDRNTQAALDLARDRKPNLDHKVVKLFQGARYRLYSYRIFDDIRLVCSPHLQTAHFGGDPDNFTYPRYGIDFSFCRAYIDDKPADTSKYHFTWSKSGADEGELVFVTGSPGSTGRLLTYAQLLYMRDVFYPATLDLIHDRLDTYRAMSAMNPQMEKRMRTAILGLENADKAYTGYLDGLLDPTLMSAKAEFEKALREKIASSETDQAKFGDAWGKLESIAQRQRAHLPRSRYHNTFRLPVLVRASAIVKAIADPSDKNIRAAKRSLRPISPDAEAALPGLWRLAVKWLSAEDPYRVALLRGQDAKAALESLVANSKVGDEEFVTALLDGGEAALKACTDPAICAAVALQKLSAENSAEGKKLTAAEEVQATLIGQALFAAYGTAASPDATSTLRISDGIVSGYPCNGSIAPPWTTFYGLFGRATEFGNKYPFDLPQIWWDKRKSIDLSKKVDFVSTNDIIGGNSGSPMINKEKEIIGLIFDGNIEMLPNRFLYRDEIPRSVSVHSEAIIEALKKVYGARALVKELLGR